MKKLLLMLCMSFFAVSSFAQKEIYCITYPWPPYIIDSNGKQSGIEYEITEEVLSSIGYKMKYKTFPWKRVLKMIENKQADAVIGIVKNEDRESKMFFPKESFLDTYMVLFSKKDRNLNYQNINSLKGKKIGTIKGYHYSEEFDLSKEFTKYPVVQIEQNIKKLINNKIDFFIFIYL